MASIYADDLSFHIPFTLSNLHLLQFCPHLYYLEEILVIDSPHFLLPRPGALWICGTSQVTIEALQKSSDNLFLVCELTIYFSHFSFREIFCWISDKEWRLGNHCSFFHCEEFIFVLCSRLILSERLLIPWAPVGTMNSFFWYAWQRI